MRQEVRPLALETKELTIQFGGLKAVSGLDLKISQGMIFGLIGPNGAGKTTAFNLLTGVYAPTAGHVYAFGKEVTGRKPYQITRSGVARTFQNIRLFKNLSVLQNLLIALDQDPARPHHGVTASILRTRAFLAHEAAQEKRALELLEIFKMASRRDILAGRLPYGDQRRLEIIRAMATGAKILLLDEPAAGMNASETHALMTAIRSIRDQHQMTVLLIEHDMKLVMEICERVAVMEYGVKIAEGTPQEIQNNPKVIEAYLGKVQNSNTPAPTTAVLGEVLLRFEDVSVHYGSIQAIQGVSFEVRRGEIVTLLGANGAGKTTALRAISGMVKTSQGRVMYRGEEISNLPTHLTVRKRVAHAPEGRGIFLNLTVEENLDLGAWTASDKRTFAKDLAHSYELFPRLKERRKQIAGTLSGGEQQMLAIARALMAHPDLVLLDEPSLGLAPQIIEKIFEIIQSINREGKTVLLVEQNALQALRIAHKGVVLETGRVTLQGSAQALLESDEVRKAYLGG